MAVDAEYIRVGAHAVRREVIRTNIAASCGVPTGMDGAKKSTSTTEAKVDGLPPTVKISGNRKTKDCDGDVGSCPQRPEGRCLFKQNLMNASLPIVPICFGNSARHLFGIYHPPQAPHRAPWPAVILCNAFGQEAIRAHRFQRLLAERLARAGHAVLRFDYYGTGDSMGDDADVDLDGWSQDILTAHRELQRRSGTTRIVWAGMRLGATAALRAAHNAPANLASLVLWEPVLDGVRYLVYLRERHIESLASEYSLPLSPGPRERARDLRCYRDEAIGFALSPHFRKQLEAIRIETYRWPATPSDIIVIVDPSTADGKDLEQARAQDPGRVRKIDMQHGTNWTTDTANNSPLVPAAALMMMMQLMAEAA